MKKQLHIKLIISSCFLLLLSINLQAQGEWQWARSYSGQDDNMNGGLYNQITRSVFDSQGNIYIAGTIGENAFLDNDENLSEGPTFGFSAVFIAKFDHQGNLLWKKSIKDSEHNTYTNWIDIVGDTSIVLFANLYAPGGNGGERLWYLDTLITGAYPNPPTYPGTGGWYNCFISFDLDGNKRSEYFLQQKQFNSEGTAVAGGALSIYELAPFYIDKNGYTYISLNIGKYNNNVDTLKIIVNNQKTFGCGTFSMSNNAWLLKFTPNFDLVWSKQIIRDTSGRGKEPTVASFYPYPRGITVDDDEYIYLTGHIYHFCSDDPSYYREINLGSGQKLILNDAGCEFLGFIIKYDTTGEPIWTNQVFGEKKVNIDSSFSSSYSTVISNSTINKDDSNLYILGYGYYSQLYLVNGQLILDSTICKLFFDDSTQLRFEIDTSTGNPKAFGVFFSKLNKETGKYISHGITEGQLYPYPREVSIVARNNQIIGEVFYRHHLKGIDTIYNTGGVMNPGLAVVRWKDDGQLIDVVNIPVFPDQGKTREGNTIMNDNGDLFITGMYSNEITFGDIVLHGSSRSNAFMAKYTDTTFLHPYTESGIRDISSINENGITVYPNPTKDNVYITTQGERINSYSLYSINGQLLLKSEKLKTTSEKINLSAFSKGVYIIKIITNKNVYSKKIIVKQ